MDSTARRIAASLALLVGMTSGSDPERATAFSVESGFDFASVHWALQLPVDGPVPFSGVASFDDAGVPHGPMLYQAPDVAGGIAGVITHGIIVGSVKRKQRARMQEEADSILEPYREVLTGYRHQELAQSALSAQPFGASVRLIGTGDAPDAEWRFVTAPKFSLTQDQRAVVLDNSISIYAPGSTTPAYKRGIRVVSRPREEGVDATAWLANDGLDLKNECAQLLAESIRVALRTASTQNENGTSFKTIRYRQGGMEKFERGQPLFDGCGRIVIRTLRDTLMSVPVMTGVRDHLDTNACTAPMRDEENDIPRIESHSTQQNVSQDGF